MAEVAVREVADIRVDALMTKAVRSVKPETSIEELTELMTVYDYNGFPVVDAEGILQGVVTRTDVLKLYLPPYRHYIDAAGRPTIVAQIMSRGVIVVRPEERMISAIALMVEHRVVTIPVVVPTLKGPQVVGIITRRDAAGALKP